MKLSHSQKETNALTITEVLVVVATLSLLGAVALAAAVQTQADDQRKACVNNLKQICLAYRIWEGDNGDKFPQQVSSKLGGAMEAAARGNVTAIFQVMSNELSTPKILICPADTNRFSADNFADFDNSHISYFAGLDASDGEPQMLLSGDSNLAIDGKPVPTGLLNLPTNAPVAWTADRHINQGNLGLADGSVWQVDDNLLLLKLQATGHANNRLAIP
jgi:type II secretory pathway pseudopilin PulG